MNKEMTINEYYLTTIDELGDKIDNDIDLLCEYLTPAKYEELCELAEDTFNISLAIYEVRNGIEVCGNEGAFTKEFKKDTPLNEVVDYMIEQMSDVKRSIELEIDECEQDIEIP
jgi:enolase